MPGKVIKIKAWMATPWTATWRRPPATPKAGLLVLQEIFGVTAHMRQVTDEFAAQGYLALAPALFDRLQARHRTALRPVRRGPGPDAAAGHRRRGQGPGRVRGRACAASLPAGAKVGAVGYCWGGAIADLAACRTDMEAAVVLLRPGQRELAERATPLPGALPLRREGSADPAGDRGADPERPARSARPGYTRMPVTASAATSGPSFTRRATRSRWNARWRSSRSTRLVARPVMAQLRFAAQPCLRQGWSRATAMSRVPMPIEPAADRHPPDEGLDRRQLLTAAAGLAATLGISVAPADRGSGGQQGPHTGPAGTWAPSTASGTT